VRVVCRRKRQGETTLPRPVLGDSEWCVLDLDDGAGRPEGETTDDTPTVSAPPGVPLQLVGLVDDERAIDFVACDRDLGFGVAARRRRDASVRGSSGPIAAARPMSHSE
jgi:hypothetical protein